MNRSQREDDSIEYQIRKHEYRSQLESLHNEFPDLSMVELCSLLETELRTTPYSSHHHPDESNDTTKDDFDYDSKETMRFKGSVSQRNVALVDNVKSADTYDQLKHVKDLEKIIVNAHRQTENTKLKDGEGEEDYNDELHEEISTKIFRRDSKVGLGMTINEYSGYIYVLALICLDGTKVFSNSSLSDLREDNLGPAQVAGVRPGDCILGINGIPFQRYLRQSSNLLPIINSTKPSTSTASLYPSLISTTKSGSFESHESASSHQNNNESSTEILKYVAQMIQNTSDPIMLHVCPPSCSLICVHNYGENENVNNTGTQTPVVTASATPLPNPVHPFARQLTSHGLLSDSSHKSKNSLSSNSTNESIVTMQINNMSQRAYQWEEYNSFFVDRLHTNKLLHTVPQELVNSTLPQQCTYAPSALQPRKLIQHLNHSSQNIFKVPLNGISKALNVRIVNTFLDTQTTQSLRFPQKNPSPRVAYTIWVYDVELGKEWYSPVRYFNDFQDLRKEIRKIDSSLVTQIPFPSNDIDSSAFTSSSSSSASSFFHEISAGSALGNGWKASGIEGTSGRNSGEDSKEYKCRQLEYFLRTLCTYAYTCTTLGQGLTTRIVSDADTDGVNSVNTKFQQVAIHVQSFLGCEIALQESIQEKGDVIFWGKVNDDKIGAASEVSNQTYNGALSDGKGEDSVEDEEKNTTSEEQRPSPPSFVAFNVSKFVRKMKDNKTVRSQSQKGELLLLHRALQRYVYRIFLLPVMNQLVSQFILTMKKRIPTLNQMRSIILGTESSSAKANQITTTSNVVSNKAKLKETVQKELFQVRDFLDQMQEMIFEGSRDEWNTLVTSILPPSSQSKDSDNTVSEDKNYLKNNTLFLFMTSQNGTLKESFFSECVRHQVEIEVYVPLRSHISRILVNGWRQEDLEIHFKMQELRKRSQSFFQIKKQHESKSNWESVSKILSMGVAISTLPCEKLQAIVDAAKEISRLYEEEQSSVSDEVNGGGKKKQIASLSADDFLPIFIFCVVRSDLERPCALCVLLRTLCDPSKRIGETGYYLASFEAAISHIGEIDLSSGDQYHRSPLL